MGWIVALIGDKLDLSVWEQSLPTSSDPWCEKVTAQDGKIILALRSRIFDNLKNATEVWPHADLLIAKLNGALRIEFPNIKTLSFSGQIGRIDDHGQLQWFSISSGNAEGQGLARGISAAPSPPKSHTQLLIEAAEANKLLADMLIFTGRADNWFDLYKALEFAIKIAGSKQKLQNLLPDADRQNYNDMFDNAGANRHSKAYTKYKEPKRKVTIPEANSLLSKTLTLLLQSNNIF